MARLHLLAGALTLAVFALTGQILRHHHPPLDTLGDAARLMFRSRHIYILAAGLVNFVLGLYVFPRKPGWRREAQKAGSALLLLAPVLLITAFFRETAAGFRPELPWSSYGLYTLLGGVILHAAGAVRAPAEKSKRLS